jgi:hypothetical protein
VRLVEHYPPNTYSTVIFENDHKVSVQGPPDVIISAAKARAP